MLREKYPGETIVCVVRKMQAPPEMEAYWPAQCSCGNRGRSAFGWSWQDALGPAKPFYKFECFGCHAFIYVTKSDKRVKIANQCEFCSKRAGGVVVQMCDQCFKACCTDCQSIIYGGCDFKCHKCLEQARVIGEQELRVQRAAQENQKAKQNSQAIDSDVDM